MNFSPIGTVRSTRLIPFDDNWNHESVYIELTPEFTAEALMGLGDFSHVEVLFYMDKVDPKKIVKDARHPRENPEWPKVGIFAQRGKNRPNQIGLTICEILKVEGTRLHLKGLDAIDGTPVLDLKPWMNEFAPQGSTKQPAWSSELMRSYWGTPSSSTKS